MTPVHKKVVTSKRPAGTPARPRSTRKRRRPGHLTECEASASGEGVAPCEPLPDRGDRTDNQPGGSPLPQEIVEASEMDAGHRDPEILLLIDRQQMEFPIHSKHLVSKLILISICATQLKLRQSM
ncbi:uncharacterized protein LOC110458999 [Mizuhopecten yessoensis]|uniref:uncharacterized protein LOC110458999 n=1 Tax=Mizuhopecten yessoensis TaxID=6573 RepID=UPI000B45EFC8|nr:uncharacterized protein LOC110458999 [Mizuhopecten yessoensis]